jgi:glutamate 5-kinase
MARRVVVKVGTSVLTGGTRNLDGTRMRDVAEQCCTLRERGVEVTLCSSGAIAAGRERMGIRKQPLSVPTKQMLAAVGQSRLMELWEQIFRQYDTHVGQLLLTREDIADRRRYLNARDTLWELLRHGVVPIVNENDAVTTAEIRVGDNDVLSALCVILADADLLLILTDQAGFLTGDPRRDPTAELIPEIRSVDDDLRALAHGSVSGLGVGGMGSKLKAAEIARRCGATVVIAQGGMEDVIQRVVAGERIGTRFPAMGSPLEGRRRWIFGTPASSRIVVDAGAVQALTRSQSSLLPAGVVGVEGTFERGDTVSLVGPSGTPLARGIARYDSAEVLQIAGVHSDRIPEILGYNGGPVVVHREDLILV